MQDTSPRNQNQEGFRALHRTLTQLHQLGTKVVPDSSGKPLCHKKEFKLAQVGLEDRQGCKIQEDLNGRGEVSLFITENYNYKNDLLRLPLCFQSLQQFDARATPSRHIFRRVC